MIGQTISHYLVIEILVVMGLVCRAEDERLRCFAAVKFSPDGVARDLQTLFSRFQLKEQAAPARIDPNICRLTGSGWGRT